MPEPTARKSLRKAQLAGRWYPDRASEVRREIEGWGPYLAQGGPECPGAAGADKALCVVPHAGWFFSGKLAAKALKAAGAALGAGGPEAVVVLGGHLPAGSPVIVYPEEGWETPLDPVRLAPELAGELARRAGGGLRFRSWEGPTGDNTVEVELPLLKHYFPEAEVLALRAAPDEGAAVLGRALLELFRDKRTLFVASTDLTHYGEAYGFSPAGPGPAGEKFREENDRRFIEAALALDLRAMLDLGNRRFAACSAGAAAAAAAVASEIKAAGSLVGYYASTDILPGEQSVGYAGIVYAP